MGATTGIAWADATFNPWWGCVEVSPGCDNCYAWTLSHRAGHDVWGKDAPRRFFGDGHWKEPLAWDRRARTAGKRLRVFCSSMADVLEERDDLNPWRRRLWGLIERTEQLDWLLLTKRAGSLRRLVPEEIRARENVWLGVTVESPDYLWRAEALVDVEAAGPRWVSYEPALAAVDFRPFLRCPHRDYYGDIVCPECGDARARANGIDWLIVGGESGPGAREFDVGWARAAIAQCRAVGATPFVKQLGARPIQRNPLACAIDCQCSFHYGFRDRRAAADPTEWPPDLQVQEVPRCA